MIITAFQVFLLVISILLLVRSSMKLGSVKSIVISFGGISIFFITHQFALRTDAFQALPDFSVLLTFLYFILLLIFEFYRRKEKELASEIADKSIIHKSMLFMMSLFGVCISHLFFAELNLNQIYGSDYALTFRDIGSIYYNQINFFIILSASVWLFYECLRKPTDVNRLYLYIYVPFANASLHAIGLFKDDTFVIMDYIFLLSVALILISSILTRAAHVKFVHDCIKKTGSVPALFVHANKLFIFVFFASWIAAALMYLSATDNVNTEDFGMYLTYVIFAMLLPVITSLIHWGIRFGVLVKDRNLTIETINFPLLIVHLSGLMALLQFFYF